MCIMGGVGVGNGVATRALASVRERLATPHGIMLVQPPFSEYRVELGEISSYPPGYKENGSVFCHTNPCLMIAEALAGDSDRAFDYGLQLMIDGMWAHLARTTGRAGSPSTQVEAGERA